MTASFSREHSLRRVRLVSLPLLMSAGLLSATVSAQTAPGVANVVTDPSLNAEAESRLAAQRELTDALGRIAADGSDFIALSQAGRAALRLGDARAALGFLGRAEALNSRDPIVKAALGAAMVQLEDPQQALRYFDAAVAAGGLDRTYMGDRGLAFDLLGDQTRAQADYAVAMQAVPSAELTRRYAISLGISGQADRAVQMLGPLLRAQDRAAWRSRAMIVAMNGRPDEARQIAQTTMPAQLASALDPYFALMDRLTPAQLAAASHFGRFPSYDVVRNQPSRSEAVRLASAQTAQRQPTASTQRNPASRRRDRTQTQTASTTRSSRRSGQQATTVAAAPAPSPASSVPAALDAPRPPANAQAVVAQIAPTPTPAPTSAPAAARRVPTPTPRVAQTVPSPSPTPGSGMPAAATGVSAVATPTPTIPRDVASAAPAPTPSLAPRPEPASVTAATTAGAPAGPPDGALRPSSPPAQVVGTALPPSTTVVATPSSGPAVAAPVANTTVVAGWSMADLVESIDVPDTERAASSGALNPDEVQAIAAERRRQQQAAAAEARARAQAEARDRAAAEAEARRRAEAEAAAREEAERRRRNPARIWVQVATGADANALSFDCRRLTRQYASNFQGQNCSTVEWGRTRRLLVGPFRDQAAAREWEQAYKRAGGDAFVWSSEVGEEVAPIGRR